jgi:hypothetical protein
VHDFLEVGAQAVICKGYKRLLCGGGSTAYDIDPDIDMQILFSKVDSPEKKQL